MKIGILQTGHVHPSMGEQGDYDVMFERLLGGQGFDFTSYDVEGGVIPGDPQDCDGWLITGSKHGAYEDHPWIPPLEDFIRAVKAADVPLIGVCFGHQIIAQALGGKVEKYARGWSVGRKLYDFGGQTIPLNAWHQDQVTEVPEGGQVVASSEFCANAAIAYGDKIFTLQPHPEYNAQALAGLIRHRGPGVVPSDLLAQAEADLAAPVDAQAMADRFAAVFKGTSE
ncbi:type 1 glutamine amidotransferase [Pseudooceanicola sp.]|uniref:type 1 glutamine amidotransferase n=1 Tax=Pseudooceanicola sp. TaxID=1914328 RepID=UPI0026197640|nr:type 1 glutamine amidotransferase [Pseudooceanicola sp.]MDF1854754.1 type 1 glutamine amidotransferase [Pseudooceanicola sp.]